MSEEENHNKTRKIYHFPRVRREARENSGQVEESNFDRLPVSPDSNTASFSDQPKTSVEEPEANDRISQLPDIEKVNEKPDDRLSEVTISDDSSVSPINEEVSPSTELKILEDSESNKRKIYHFPRVKKYEGEKVKSQPVSYPTAVLPTKSLKLITKSLWQQKRSLMLEAFFVAAIAIVLIFIIPPLLTVLGQGFRVNLLGRFLALAIVALGIDLIWGYTGMLSLGHGVFFALGGYALAMHLKLQIPSSASNQLPEFMNLYGVTELPWFWQPFYSFPLTMISVIIIPSILAAILGYLVFRNRIRGVYFSILTQAATIVFFNFFNGQQKLFNGTNGLTDFKTVLGFTVNNNTTQFIFYTLTVILLVGAYALCRWLTSGRFGRLLIAIRDDEPRVRFSGYDPTGFKVLIFAISAGLAGIAGAMFTLQTGLISPKAMDIAFSIEMVIWVAVGGRATLIGAVLGAVTVNFAKSILSEQLPEVWLFFQGALFLIVVTVLPGGLVGWLQSDGMEKLGYLLGIRKYATTYPSLQEDPEVQLEREELETE